MEKYKLYFSNRGIPLVYTGTEHLSSVLTVENYCKWYDFYLVYPSGRVEPVDSEAILAAQQIDPEAIFVDHIYHPRVAYIISEQLNAELCKQSVEMITGRWILESNQCADAAKALHLFPLSDVRSHPKTQTFLKDSELTLDRRRSTVIRPTAIGSNTYEVGKVSNLVVYWHFSVTNTEELPALTIPGVHALVNCNFIYTTMKDGKWALNTTLTKKLGRAQTPEK